MVNFNVDYDKDADDLFLYSEEKSKGSVEIGDLVLDFDRKRKLVGVEILNATNFLVDCVANGKEISKEFLSSLIKCEVKIEQKNNFLFIKMLLIGKNAQGKKAQITCTIPTPHITKTSPALAYT